MHSATLELRDLRRSFGTLLAVDGVSFSIPPGRLCGFVGRNGAGKTTTMRMICGLLEPDAGTVTWRGQPINDRARARIGYMPEERGLYPKMRVGDQLEYFAVLHGTSHPHARAAARSWLERLGVADRLNERVEALSHGNQQRVQLAAALVHEPDLLILDEPFAGLDPVAADVMVDVLRTEAARGVPVLFSSHQLDVVERLCESVAIIDHGRLVAYGDVDGLRQTGPHLVSVTVPDALPGWIDRCPGVKVVEGNSDGYLLELGDAVDSQTVLDAARRAGTVTQFSERHPTLSQLFREVISA